MMPDRSTRKATAYTERNEAGASVRDEPKVKVYIRCQSLHVARTPTVMGATRWGGETVSLPTSEANRLVADECASLVE
jgi:hypothetical protein